jgi:hypothetical protein
MNARLTVCAALAAALLLGVSGRARLRPGGAAKKISIRFVNPDATNLKPAESVWVGIFWPTGHDAKECVGGKLENYDFKGQDPEEFSIAVLPSASNEHPTLAGLSARSEQNIVLVYRKIVWSQLTRVQIETLVTDRLASFNRYLRVHKAPTEDEREARYRKALETTIAEAKRELLPELKKRVSTLDDFAASIKSVRVVKDDVLVATDADDTPKVEILLPGVDWKSGKVTIDKKNRISLVSGKGEIRSVVIDKSTAPEKRMFLAKGGKPLKVVGARTHEDKGFLQPLRDDLVKWQKALEAVDVVVQPPRR